MHDQTMFDLAVISRDRVFMLVFDPAASLFTSLHRDLLVSGP